jgi:hypothetical protein
MPTAVWKKADKSFLRQAFRLSLTPSQIREINPASRSRRILARAFRDEVPHIRHQHAATEPRDQRVLAILAAARTQIAREPHYPVWPWGVLACEQSFGVLFF